MTSPNKGYPRRFFIKSTAASLAAAGLPAWFLQEKQGRAATRKPGPNDKPTVALIGCGGMGRGDARNASRFGQVTTVCDVDERRMAEAAKEFGNARQLKDFREVVARDDIDVVVCGTVDHWHTFISLSAMKAGKDIYCEKPLTLTIDEGKRLVKAQRETKRILQTGSQQRSDRNFRLACELVRNGRVGKLKQVDVWLPSGPRKGPFDKASVPEGLDWNAWLGQCPKVDYVPERCHGTFRYWWDYSGGTMTDWGAHHNDIALWGLGLDRSGPVGIEGRPLVKMIPGGYTAASEYEVIYTYENGVTHNCRSTTADTASGGVKNKEGQRHGVRFVGSDGWIWVTRGNIEASQADLLQEPLGSNAVRLYESNDHMGNFFDCVRSRKQPVCEAEIGHRSASVCHLGVISMRLGRKLAWDPVKEQFVNDAEANRWVAREMREEWDYDSVLG